MRVLARLVFAIAAIALSGIGLYAQDGKAIEAQVLKLDQDRLKAITDADMTAVGNLIWDDYIHSHGSGQLNDKSQYLAGLAKSPRASYRPEGQVPSVRVYGDTAVMVGPQFNKTGTQEPQEYLVTLIWVRKGGVWKQVGAAYSPMPAPKAKM